MSTTKDSKTQLSLWLSTKQLARFFDPLGLAVCLFCLIWFVCVDHSAGPVGAGHVTAVHWLPVSARPCADHWMCEKMSSFPYSRSKGMTQGEHPDCHHHRCSYCHRWSMFLKGEQGRVLIMMRRERSRELNRISVLALTCLAGAYDLQPVGQDNGVWQLSSVLVNLRPWNLCPLTLRRTTELIWPPSFTSKQQQQQRARSMCNSIFLYFVIQSEERRTRNLASQLGVLGHDDG